MTRQERIKCTFCDAEAVGFGLVNPPMCQRHYEVARMACILERKATGVTLPGIRRMLTRMVEMAPAGAVVATAEEVPRLLWDLLESRERVWTADSRTTAD